MATTPPWIDRDVKLPPAASTMSPGTRKTTVIYYTRYEQVISGFLYSASQPAAAPLLLGKLPFYHHYFYPEGGPCRVSVLAMLK